MNPKVKIITGFEDTIGQLSQMRALIRFYYAFNTGDISLMSLNWDNSQDIIMANPVGGIRRGWAEIKMVYENIFNGPAGVYVEFYDFVIYTFDGIFIAIGREKGFYKRGSEEIELHIRTSRIFKKKEDDWLQIHHHGSVENAELLSRYQSAVLG